MNGRQLAAYVEAITNYRTDVDFFIVAGESAYDFEIEWQNGIDGPTLGELQAQISERHISGLKIAAARQLTAAIVGMEAEIFTGGDVNKLVIYKDKQMAVLTQVPAGRAPDWQAITPPDWIADEWASRVALDDKIVSAGGAKIAAESALDLYKTWWVNTRFAGWLRGKSEAARVRANAVIATAATEAEISTAVKNFNTTLAGLDAEYAAGPAQQIIDESGLTPLS